MGGSASADTSRHRGVRPTFAGLTFDPISPEALGATREALITRIHAAFTDDNKRFLLSVKRGEPDWKLLGVPEVENLPAVQWKLLNPEKTGLDQCRKLLDQLSTILGG